MPRLGLLLLCAGALACGKMSRSVGLYKPELSSAGAAGAAGAASDSQDSPPDLSQPWPSRGCGKPLPQRVLANGYSSWQVAQTGETLVGNNPALQNLRSFYVHAPTDYDSGRPYRVVYQLRGGCDSRGDLGDAVYDLANESLGGDPQAVYVDVTVPQLDQDPHCYDTGSGAGSLEYEAFELIHTQVEGNYCIDNNRIFVAGYSQGGALANMWGCYFSGIPDPPRKFSPKWAIRGHAVVAGWREPNQPLPCNGADAAIWIQESGDVESGMYFGSNPAALELSLRSNGCTGNYEDGPKRPWRSADLINGFNSGECQQYTGCSIPDQLAHPLVFCRVDGPGNSDRADLAVPAFTAFFQSMDPEPQGSVSSGGSGSTLGGNGNGTAGSEAAGGAAATGGNGPINGECPIMTTSPVCDFGVRCSSDESCSQHDCYVPGTTENPICAKHCVTPADCPAGSACVGPFGAPRHCFVTCENDDQCLAINDSPDNPLACVGLDDPSAPGVTVCAESSEP
jgi:hypothetical protein